MTIRLLDSNGVYPSDHLGLVADLDILDILEGAH